MPSPRHNLLTYGEDGLDLMGANLLSTSLLLYQCPNTDNGLPKKSPFGLVHLVATVGLTYLEHMGPGNLGDSNSNAQ